MKKLYTIKGYLGNSERYIQLSDAGNPIIVTRTGYRANRVIVFRDKEQACEFLIGFINDRNRSDIKWSVEEYKPSRMSDVLVGNITHKNYYTEVCPGEISVRYDGSIVKTLYERKYAMLDKRSYVFYCRGVKRFSKVID